MIQRYNNESGGISQEVIATASPGVYFVCGLGISSDRPIAISKTPGGVIQYVYTDNRSWGGGGKTVTGTVSVLKQRTNYIDRETYYYADNYPGHDFADSLGWWLSIDPDLKADNITYAYADIFMAGEISVGSQEITVKWNRPQDEKELTTTFDIEVSDSGNDGNIDHTYHGEQE